MNTRLTNQYGGTMVYCARHIDARRPLLVGTITESASDDVCPDCRQEEQTANLPTEVREALLSPMLSHTRARRHCGNSVCIYHRDDTSPTGVMLATMAPEDVFDKVFGELRAAGLVPSFASPLSPTEGRRV